MITYTLQDGFRRRIRFNLKLRLLNRVVCFFLKHVYCYDYTRSIFPVFNGDEHSNPVCYLCGHKATEVKQHGLQVEKQD